MNETISPETANPETSGSDTQGTGIPEGRVSEADVVQFRTVVQAIQPKHSRLKMALQKNLKVKQISPIF